MKKQIFATFFIIIIPFLVSSCVSSLFKAKPPTFSQEILLTEPHSPFTRTKTSVFPSWKNSSTGNVIAIVSDCSENSSYNKLSNLNQLIESPLEEVTLIHETPITLYNKPAILRTIHAKLDGQPIEVLSAVFKKKSCGYVATLSGKLNNLVADEKEFKKFIKGFGFK